MCALGGLSDYGSMRFRSASAEETKRSADPSVRGEGARRAA